MPLRMVATGRLLLTAPLPTWGAQLRRHMPVPFKQAPSAALAIRGDAWVLVAPSVYNLAQRRVTHLNPLHREGKKKDQTSR